jgi:two-component system NtrC family sensor kinase
MTERGPDALDEGALRAIAVERSRIGVQINRVRIAGLAAWCFMAVTIGYSGRPEWLVPLPALAIGLAVAIALELAVPRTRVARYLWLATPLLDVPIVGLVQNWFLDASIRPAAVAIFTVAIVSSLVFVAQLSFTRWGIAATFVGALVCSWIILTRAHLPSPNMLSAVLLLVWAATVATFSSSRTRHLVSRIAREQRGREAELAALVETRTRSLAAAQADLVRAERMASVATLVKGIAHELNNPINYIAGNIPPLERYVRFVTEAATQLGDGSVRSAAQIAAIVQLDPRRDLAFVAADLKALTQDIAEGARRAKLIVGDLQSLTSGSNRAIEEVDLGRVIEQTHSLFAARLPPGVTLAMDITQGPPMRARAGQLEQVMVNLVDNAIRAVKASGRVEMKLVRDGAIAVLSVRDDGSGMTDEERQHACEPFFTTRSAGEGSGLGLAIVAQIVEGHGGVLVLESAPGKGTTVTLRLPLNGA